MTTQPDSFLGEESGAGPLTLDERRLRTGWTTGACAVAATKAACIGLLHGSIPPRIEIVLPKPPPIGCKPEFNIEDSKLTQASAMAAVIKDAGDDPDVTHGALVRVTIRRGIVGRGLRYRAGEGVGTVSREGLPIPVGEPAITPGPRGMMQANLAPIFELEKGQEPDLEVTLSIPGGVELAKKTLNGRLGILGGLSILGTTGIVRPYSCAAWVASIHRGIDVARAAGLTHVAACTGSTSERWAQQAFSMEEAALLDMGDFAGATFKYLRRHPVQRVSLVGGFAKISKLAQGAMDLHSGRSRLDMNALAELITNNQGLRHKVATAHTGAEAFKLSQEEGFNLANGVAALAQQKLEALTRGCSVLDVTILDRSGHVIGASPTPLTCID